MRQPRSFGSVRRMVVDTSVIINLNATGVAGPIIRALGVPLVASTMVRDELVVDRISGRNDGDMAARLAAEGLLLVEELDYPSLELFESLVSGPAADTLDDGEAATLALAISTDSTACIDERKALRIAGKRFPALGLFATVDLLRSEPVLAALGHEGLVEALLGSLKNARMRIPEDHFDWAKAVLGHRVSECVSLPTSLRQHGN